MYNDLGISSETIKLVEEAEKDCIEQFRQVDEACNYNSLKVLRAFHKNQVNESCFNSTTGYGYGDYGRDTIEKVFRDVLGAEDAIVRNQFISGSHTLYQN